MYLYRIYVSRYPLSLACRYMIGESKSLFLVLGSHCAVFHRHRTGCMPGVQRCISCLLCVLVCSLMSALVLSRAHSKFFQHSNPTGCLHLQRSSRITFVINAETSLSRSEQEDVVADSWIIAACCGAVASPCAFSLQHCHYWTWN